MPHALETPLAPLARDFRELRSRGDAFVLATVVATEGSTYRKCGAQMLIAAGGDLRGLLSGGCLEVDLVLHAREVLETGCARLVSYDMRGADDLVFGIGSGCEGAMRVLLQRIGPAEKWQPMAVIADCADTGRSGSLALVVDGAAAGLGWWGGGASAPWPEPDAVLKARCAVQPWGEPCLVDCEAGGQALRVLALPLRAPPVLLVCGAGADAVPLARHAVALGFAVTVADHRPALAQAERFPHCDVACVPVMEFGALPALARAEAAIVMSHHLEADLAWLRAIAAVDGLDYVGLLGPAARRERLLAGLGAEAAELYGRLHAPLGLDIGARTPEAIAIAAIAELHAWYASRTGGPWSDILPAAPR